MDVVCEYCGALKFSGETPGLCCLSGKVNLPLLTSSPELLHSLLRGDHGTIFPTYRAACEELNLLENDTRDTTKVDAIISAPPSHIPAFICYYQFDMLSIEPI
ncbi:unnamed protein product [Pieris macdunnoughi]|nr:unnamed protein product [Pieris macdunnoughi]